MRSQRRGWTVRLPGAPGHGQLGRHRRGAAKTLGVAAARSGISADTVATLPQTGASMAGASVAELMHRLGHSTPAMAMEYQHSSRERDAELGERLSAVGERPGGRWAAQVAVRSVRTLLGAGYGIASQGLCGF